MEITTKRSEEGSGRKKKWYGKRKVKRKYEILRENVENQRHNKNKIQNKEIKQYK